MWTWPGRSRGTSTPTWNEYSYVIGNPLAYTDPRGEKRFYVGEEWIFFEDTDVIEVVTVNEDGTSSTIQLQGEDSVVFFDGSALTLLNPDGLSLTRRAVSGLVDASGRVFLNPAPERETYGRSGIAIHGGSQPGSRGCIDLCDKAPDFFGAVDRSFDKIRVYVRLPRPMTLRGLDRGVAIALLLVLAFLTTLTVVDLYGLSTRTSEYEQVYGFTGTERAWSHRSEGNYIAGSVLRLAFFLAGIGLAAWSLRSQRPSGARALYLYILVAVVLLAVNYVRWWRSGFGH